MSFKDFRVLKVSMTRKLLLSNPKVLLLKLCKTFLQLFVYPLPFWDIPGDGCSKLD